MMKKNYDDAFDAASLWINPITHFLFNFRFFGAPSLYECMTGDVKGNKFKRL